MAPSGDTAADPAAKEIQIATSVDGQKVTEGRQPSLRLVELTKAYGDKVRVDHLNLSVYPGELYALLGDNGAGKTTTISMLTTLVKPTSGEFYLCGYNGISESEKTKGAFGVVSQDVSIYMELTAYENLSFVADLYGIPRHKALPRIAELLEHSGLTERANDLAGSFSGGMQRKLSIAAALLHEPQVLFLDEPTVGLDPASRRQIWFSLKELKKRGVTILLTTHYLEEAELLADRIGIIRKGRLVAEGTIEELRDKIMGVRSIAIRLSRHVDENTLKAKLHQLRERFPVEVRRDHLRNTISFSQPKDKALVSSLHHILDWLEEQQIPFSRFATSEPNLEEVFLAVATDPTELDEEMMREQEADLDDY